VPTHGHPFLDYLEVPFRIFSRGRKGKNHIWRFGAAAKNDVFFSQ
jgi:hypothetical protein